jgi:hypothetical protein
LYYDYETKETASADNIFEVMRFVEITSISGSTIVARGNAVTIDINGKNLRAGSEIKLIKDAWRIIPDSTDYVSSDKITASFVLPPDAQTGDWDLSYFNSLTGENIIKNNALKVITNMSIFNVSENFAIKEFARELIISGSDFQSGSVVKFTGENTEIYASNIIAVSTDIITCSVVFPSDVQDGLKVSIEITNATGNLASKADVITVQAAPKVNSFTPKFLAVENDSSDTRATLKIKGSNFFSGYTGFYLKNEITGAEIFPDVIKIENQNTLMASFDISSQHIGKWIAYLTAYQQGPQYNIGLLTIAINDGLSHAVKKDSDVKISFPVESAKGIINLGHMLIKAYTFDKDITITIEQNKSLLGQKSSDSKFKFLNSSLKIDSQNSQPSKDILIQLPYTDDDLNGADEKDLVIAVYDENQNAWTACAACEVDRQNKLVSAYINRLSQAAIMTPAGSDSLAAVKYYPNPLRPSKGASYSKMNFTNLPQDSTIIIYTILGRKAATLRNFSEYSIVWDGKNDDGNNVASGIYLARIQDSKGNKRTIKIAVER